jgi:hypothetical protein
MIARIFCTAGTLGLAGFEFFGNAVPADPLSPFGIVFLTVSGVVWFGWETIGDAYAYREEICPNRGHEFLQTERLGPALVNRLVGRDLK